MNKQSEKALKTRDKIIGAANALFYANGYNRTGMDEILKSSGVTRGNFYYHFQSKEEVALASIDRFKNRFFDSLPGKTAKNAGSPLKLLIRFVEDMEKRIVADNCRKGCFFGNLSLEMSPYSEAVRKSLHRFFREVKSYSKELIDGAKKNGELRKEIDSELTASMILALMEGSILLGKTGRDPGEVRKAVRFIKKYLAGAGGP